MFFGLALVCLPPSLEPKNGLSKRPHNLVGIDYLLNMHLISLRVPPRHLEEVGHGARSLTLQLPHGLKVDAT